MCVQKGEKENRGWKHWIEGDLLHLVNHRSTPSLRNHLITKSSIRMNSLRMNAYTGIEVNPNEISIYGKE